MKIEEIRLSALKAYKNNNKKHPAEQITKIKSSIENFGFRNPILVDKDDFIIAGHGRSIAARELGLLTVPCIRIEDLNENQIRALRIADNKVAESEFDFDALKYEFEELDAAGFDLDSTAFDFDEIVDITGDKEEKSKSNITKKNPSKIVHTCPACGAEFQ